MSSASRSLKVSYIECIQASKVQVNVNCTCMCMLYAVLFTIRLQSEKLPVPKDINYM